MIRHQSPVGEKSASSFGITNDTEISSTFGGGRGRCVLRLEKNIVYSENCLLRHIQIQVEIELTIISIIMKPKVGQQHIERIYVKVTAQIVGKNPKKSSIMR